MNNHVKEIFADYEYLLRNFKRNQYVRNMELFRNKWEDLFKETIERKCYMADSEGFVEQIKKIYSRFGKIGKLKKIDLGLFMVYFIFPAILLTEISGATEFADALKTAWNNEFNTNLEYLEYDEIVANFNDKMFGIF